MTYPNDIETPTTVPLKRWRTSTYPIKYALGISSPGIEYTEDSILGRIGTTQLNDTVPLREFINGAGDRFYTIDAAGGGINTDLFIENPTPIGYVANIQSTNIIL